LAGEGIAVGRDHVRTLMRRMGIEALYRRPNTSVAAAGRKRCFDPIFIDGS
jgi:putative transposase